MGFGKPPDKRKPEQEPVAAWTRWKLFVKRGTSWLHGDASTIWFFVVGISKCHSQLLHSLELFQKGRRVRSKGQMKLKLSFSSIACFWFFQKLRRKTRQSYTSTCWIGGFCRVTLLEVWRKAEMKYLSGSCIHCPFQCIVIPLKFPATFWKRAFIGRGAERNLGKWRSVHQPPTNIGLHDGQN